MRLSAVEKRIGGQNGEGKLLHTSFVCNTGFMCVLKSLGITQGFVAAQKESKDVTDKDLLTMGGVSELFDQLKWILDIAIDFGMGMDG